MPSDAAAWGAADPAKTRAAGRWNYRAAVPLAQNPLFQGPLRPRAVFRWYAAFWLERSTTTLCLAIALIAYVTILPELAEIQVRGWGWLTYLVPQVICAGTLHYWLITRKGRGDQTKYDPRDQARSNGTFTFGNQVNDNMFWHIVSGIPLWTAAQGEVFFRHLHHRYFECNCGTVEMPRDCRCGSYHDGSARGMDETRVRKTQMYRA